MSLKLLQSKPGNSQKWTATAIELHTCKGRFKPQNLFSMSGVKQYKYNKKLSMVNDRKSFCELIIGWDSKSAMMAVCCALLYAPGDA